MALALHERGLFTWPQWAATLADEIKRAQAAGDPDTGETYYRHWLNALERLVAEKGVTDAATLARYPRRLGPRRRPHAARRADRASAGGLQVAAGLKPAPPSDRVFLWLSGVCTCSGRAPMPTSRAGMWRSGANRAMSRSARGACTAVLLAQHATDHPVLHDQLQALGDAGRKHAPLLHTLEVIALAASRPQAAATGCSPPRPRPAPRD